MTAFGFKTPMVAKHGGNEMPTPVSTTPKTPTASTGPGAIGKLLPHAFFTEDQQKELSEAYAAYRGKLRTFAEPQNVMNRGFYPSKGKFKGKMKGKPRPSSSSTSSKGKGGVAMAAHAMATVGSPNY